MGELALRRMGDLFPKSGVMPSTTNSWITGGGLLNANIASTWTLIGQAATAETGPAKNAIAGVDLRNNTSGGYYAQFFIRDIDTEFTISAIDTSGNTKEIALKLVNEDVSGSYYLRLYAKNNTDSQVAYFNSSSRYFVCRLV